MILYYSATGNTRHVAHRLAEAFDDQAVSILDAQSDGRRSFELAAGETLGIVTPTYFMGLPTLMSDFLDTLELHTANDTPYAYLVITFGNFSGTVRSSTAAALRAKGIPLAAAFGVRMVDTWTPVFDVSNQERNERIARAADAAVDDIVAAVRTRATGSHRVRTGPPLVGSLMHASWKSKRSTRPFFVESTCIGCGLCAKTCPVSAIRMEDGMPTWVADACAQCLSCLHRCPVFAIQHGPKTKGHGQWVHPDEASA
jgi:ferredoxin/flavodoxin